MSSKIWVEIETTKGIQNIFSYRGQVDIGVLNSFTSGNLSQGVIKIENVYWRNDSATSINDPLYIAYGMSETSYFDFSGDIYLKSEHVSCISTLKGLEAAQLFKASS